MGAFMKYIKIIVLSIFMLSLSLADHGRKKHKKKKHSKNDKKTHLLLVPLIFTCGES